MSSYNKFVCIGNLTRDPEIRYVGPQGTPVTKFTVAINGRKGHDEDTVFLDVNAWDKLADLANTYLKKGASVLVEGPILIRKYTDKDGNKRTATEVRANEIKFLSPKSSNGQVPATVGAANESADDLGEEIPF